MNNDFILVDLLNKKQIKYLTKIKKEHYFRAAEDMLSLCAKYLIIAIATSFVYEILNDLGGGKSTFIDTGVGFFGYWGLSAIVGLLLSTVKYKGELMLSRMEKYGIVYNYIKETTISVFLYIFVIGEFLAVGIFSSLYFEFSINATIIISITSVIYGISVVCSINRNRILSMYTSVHIIIGLITIILTTLDLSVLILLVVGGICGIGPLILIVTIFTMPFFMALNQPLTLGEAIILFDDNFWN